VVDQRQPHRGDRPLRRAGETVTGVQRWCGRWLRAPPHPEDQTGPSEIKQPAARNRVGMIKGVRMIEARRVGQSTGERAKCPVQRATERTDVERRAGGCSCAVAPAVVSRGTLRSSRRDGVESGDSLCDEIPIEQSERVGLSFVATAKHLLVSDELRHPIRQRAGETLGEAVIGSPSTIADGDLAQCLDRDLAVDPRRGRMPVAKKVPDHLEENSASTRRWAQLCRSVWDPGRDTSMRPCQNRTLHDRTRPCA